MASKETAGVASKKRVLLVDDHAVVRMGLTGLINVEPDLVVCGEAEDESQAITAAKELQPDVAVVDWSLRNRDASELITTLCHQHPQLPVLVLSVHEEHLYGEQAIRAGARAYIMKHEATEKLIETIRRVAAGEALPGQKAAAKSSTAGFGEWPPEKVALLKTLTETETNALRLIANGYSSSHIAELLVLRLKNFNALQESLKTKLRLSSTAELFQTAPRWVAESHRAARMG
ncbi:MAG: response regulator transcription factor [Verrucomicrobiia bacterium]